MKKIINAILLSMLSVVGAFAGDYGKYYSDLPLKLSAPVAPSIPDYEVNIRDFGGVSDGVTLNTDAFACAISHLEEKGGGKLTIPSGLWLTGPITLGNNINLHAELGAFVLFTDDLAAYPLVESSFEGLMVKRCQAPITAVGKHDVAITGQGIFNGNGQAWRAVKRSKTTEPQWKKLVAGGGVVGNKGNTWYPNQYIAFGNQNPADRDPKLAADPQFMAAVDHDFSRPNMVVIRDCDNVLLQGVTFENSPAWNVHPLLVRNLIVDGVNIRNPWYAQNGDGIDVESCSDVLIINTTFDVGDDAICLKSGKDKPGRDRGIPTERVLVDGCTVYHGHGGFVIGSEMSGGVKDVVCNNCVFDGTDAGLRFKSGRDRGGVVENIFVDGIYMYNIAGNAIIFNMYYGNGRAIDANGNPIPDGSDAKPVANEGTPQFRDFVINNVFCNGAVSAGEIKGLPEMPIKNVRMNNVVIRADRPLTQEYYENVDLSGFRYIPAK